MWRFALVWLGAVILFFILWALAARLIRRVGEKKASEQQAEEKGDDLNENTDNQQIES